MGIGDWGLGIGDWELGQIPNPQSPIPNPQSPGYYNIHFKEIILNYINKKNMNLVSHFNKKKLKFTNSSISSLKSVRNSKLLKINHSINKEYFKIPHSIKRLPKIKNDIIRNKKNSENKLISNNSQNQKSINEEKLSFINLSNNSIFKMNSNIISMKRPLLLCNKKKPVINYSKLNNLHFESQSQISNVKSKKSKENQIKHKAENLKSVKSEVTNDNTKIFIKTVNVYFKNNIKSSENNDEFQLPKNKNQFPKTKSMFMTGVNFLVNHNKNSNITNINNKLKSELNENINNNDNVKSFNSISFRELLKHIEENKKKIIDNQNDIENMLKTAKDTHNETSKCHHLNKII